MTEPEEHLASVLRLLTVFTRGGNAASSFGFDMSGGKLFSSATKYETIVRLKSRRDVQFDKVLLSCENPLCNRGGRKFAGILLESSDSESETSMTANSSEPDSTPGDLADCPGDVRRVVGLACPGEDHVERCGEADRLEPTDDMLSGRSVVLVEAGLALQQKASEVT